MVRRKLWTAEQDPGDYQAAENYLQFSYAPEEAQEIVTRMHAAPIVYHYAASVLRVFGLPVLPESNIHVIRVLDKFRMGQPLTPVLVVRQAFGSILADGYFRVCASVCLDEFADIPCRMVGETPRP